MKNLIDINEQAYRLEELLSVEECEGITKVAELMGFQSNALEDGPDYVDIAHDKLNNEIWLQTADYIPDPLEDCKVYGLDSTLRIYRLIGQHRLIEVGKPVDTSQSFHSKLSVHYYLNGNFSGGKAVFDGFDIAPQPGEALVFRQELGFTEYAPESGAKYLLVASIIFQSQ